MDTDLPQDNCMGKKENVLHPLVKLTSNWLDCRDQPVLNPSAQPVFVNDNIYVQGHSNQLPIIWNYSISRNSWSPLPYQKECLSDRVTIVAYQSRLLLIAALYKISDYGKGLHLLGNKVLTLSNDGSWEEDVISPLPDDLFLLNMCACSEGDVLIVAWKPTDFHVKLLFYDGDIWKMRDGPNRAIRNDSNIVICNQIVYLTNCEEYILFHKVSLSELQSSSTPKWIDIQNIPRNHSNLVSFCGHLTLIFKLTSSSVCAVQYLPTSDIWIELGDLDATFRHLPTVVGVSDTRLFLIGQTPPEIDIPLTEHNVMYVPTQFARYPIMTAPQPTIEEKFGALVVEAEVAEFNPDDAISMRVALKLEYCADIKVFGRLQSKLKIFKERAGFSMTSKSPRRMKNTHASLPWSYTYMYSNPAAICIISWIEDPNPSLPATWRNFLQILREPGMDLRDLADQIEHKLEFTRSLQVLQGSNSSTGIQEVALLRSELELLHDIGRENNTVTVQSAISSEQFCEQLKKCCQTCQRAYHKLGEEHRRYEEDLETLKKREQQLRQKLEDNITEQGLPPAKRQNLCEDRAIVMVKPTLKDLLRELRVKAADWEEIGIQLEIEDGILKQIKLDNPGDSKSCLRELFRKWLNQADPSPCWASIIEAVDGIGDENLARNLKGKYIKV